MQVRLDMANAVKVCLMDLLRAKYGGASDKTGGYVVEVGERDRMVHVTQIAKRSHQGLRCLNSPHI